VSKCLKKKFAAASAEPNDTERGFRQLMSSCAAGKKPKLDLSSGI
jgi:hypothetical protein